MKKDLINGPWSQSDDVIFNDKGVHVATVGNSVNMDNGTTTDDELCAWLSLIEAAPDLLSALTTAQWMLERDYIDPQKRTVIEKCRAAISKAKGEQS